MEQVAGLLLGLRGRLILKGSLTVGLSVPSMPIRGPFMLGYIANTLACCTLVYTGSLLVRPARFAVPLGS